MVFEIITLKSEVQKLCKTLQTNQNYVLCIPSCPMYKQVPPSGQIGRPVWCNKPNRKADPFWSYLSALMVEPSSSFKTLEMPSFRTRWNTQKPNSDHSHHDSLKTHTTNQIIQNVYLIRNSI